MSIKVINAFDFAVQARLFVERSKNSVIQKLSEDAKKTIEEKSEGALVPQVIPNRNGFVVAVPVSLVDNGAKAKATERQTNAFETAYSELSNEAYVVNLLKENK